MKVLGPISFVTMALDPARRITVWSSLSQLSKDHRWAPTLSTPKTNLDSLKTQQTGKGASSKRFRTHKIQLSTNLILCLPSTTVSKERLRPRLNPKLSSLLLSTLASLAQWSTIILLTTNSTKPSHRIKRSSQVKARLSQGSKVSYTSRTCLRSLCPTTSKFTNSRLPMTHKEWSRLWIARYFRTIQLEHKHLTITMWSQLETSIMLLKLIITLVMLNRILDWLQRL